MTTTYVHIQTPTHPARLRARVKSTETRDELQLLSIRNQSYVKMPVSAWCYIPSLPQEQAAKNGMDSEVRISIMYSWEVCG